MNKYYYDSRCTSKMCWKLALPEHQKLEYPITEYDLKSLAFTLALNIKYDYIIEACYHIQQEKRRTPNTSS